MHYILLYYLVGILLFMTGVYLVCLRFKNFGLIDIAWGLNMVLVVLLSYKNFSVFSGPQYLLSICVFLWGMRLAAFLFIRNFGKDEDFRYREMRERWGEKANVHAFFKVFMLQGVLAFFLALPVIFALNEAPKNSSFFQVLGFLLWGFGFIWESWADQVKSNFKARAGNADKPCDEGPWMYSQYANYFGEVVLWWGIFVLSLPHEYFYIGIISPIMINFLILKVSGIPYLEEKNATRESYQEYRKRTNRFIPGPPKISA